MSRVSTIDTKVPAQIRRDLKASLRANGYSPLDKYVDWLADRGVSVSRAALGRWVLRLRERDNASGWDTGTLSSEDAETLELWDELEQLRRRETEILMMLKSRPMSQNTTNTDLP